MTLTLRPIRVVFLLLACLVAPGASALEDTGFTSMEEKALDRIKEARGHARQERYARALGDLRAAVALAEQAGRAQLTLALALHNMAEVYRLQGKRLDAHRAYSRALQIYTELNHQPAIAITRAQMGAALPDSHEKATESTGGLVASSTLTPRAEKRLDRIEKAVDRIRKRLGSDEQSKSRGPTPPAVASPGSIARTNTSEPSGAAPVPDAYFESVIEKITRGWRYPPSAKNRHQEGTVEVEFAISSSGEVDSIQVLQSSSFIALDIESIRSVREAAPFGAVTPPPGQQQVTIRLMFNYLLPETGRTSLKAPSAPSPPGY